MLKILEQFENQKTLMEFRMQNGSSARVWEAFDVSSGWGWAA